MLCTPTLKLARSGASATRPMPLTLTVSAAAASRGAGVGGVCAAADAASARAASAIQGVLIDRPPHSVYVREPPLFRLSEPAHLAQPLARRREAWVLQVCYPLGR